MSDAPSVEGSAGPPEEPAGDPARPVKTPPWPTDPGVTGHGSLLAVEVGGTEVVRYVDGAGSPAFDSPRPHVHPVRTLAGVVVTDRSPSDHTWHLGLNVGVQDVGGTNLWGGRTYLPGEGYTWRQDHGSVTHEAWLRRAPGAVRHRLAWRAPSGEVLLEEVRDLAWMVLDDRSWRLDLTFTLSRPEGSTDPVELGSPGSSGRREAGYGGMFWRLPTCQDIDVRTPLGHGEPLVHGTRATDGARWLAWTATVESGAPFTVAVAPGDDVTAADPWFVRVDYYPGFGSALAWDEPLPVHPGAPVRRSFRFLVADGRWTDEEVGATLDAWDEEAAR